MKIRVITAFNDQQAKGGDDPFVAAGTERTVSEERGEHLVRLGLATKVKEVAAKKAPRRKAPAKRTSPAPVASPPVAATPPQSAPEPAKPAGQ